MDFDLCKLQSTLEALKRMEVREETDITGRLWAEDPDPERHHPAIFPAQCERLSFKPFGAFERWGSAHESRVFRLDIVMPPSYAGQATFLRLTTGREGGWTAFNPQFFGYVDGHLVQGLDINHTLLPLCAKAAAGQRLQVMLHAFAGTQPGRMELRTRLLRFCPETAALAAAFETALQSMLLLGEESGERAELCLALLKVADALDLGRMQEEEGFRSHSSEAALRLLDEMVYNRDWGSSPVEAFPIGHTHIDVAWRWTVGQSRQKAQRSFSTVIALMKDFPDYRFFSSQPVLYQFVKEDNPALFAAIRDRIKEGRWEAEGGMWLEADLNLTGGESLVRQLYYGRKFLKEEFGVESEILWMPDSFGYSAVIPQLMAGFGMKYFATSKLSWNEFNRIPHDIFHWAGPDGSKVLCCMISTPDDTGLDNAPDFSTYNATLQPRNLAGAWLRRRDKKLSRAVMMPYGYGDGGGGPTGGMLQSAVHMKRGLPGLPRVNMAGAAAYFARLSEDLKGQKPAVIHGELYLEFHRGTYTSVAEIKQLNRRGELLLGALELMLALQGQDRRELREELWKRLMLHQFHDVLPGSAIAEVYADSRRDFAIIGRKSQAEIASGIRRLVPGDGRCLCILNPHWKSIPQSFILDIPGGFRPEAERLSWQRLPDGRTALHFVSLPPFSLSVLALEAQEGKTIAASRDGVRKLMNGSLALQLDEHGEISSFLHLPSGREIVPPGQALNALLLYEDRPASSDAWNIDVNYVEKMWPVNPVESIALVEDGPVCSALRVIRRFRSSRIIQTIRLFHHLPRVDFECEVDWQERQMLLKAAFPMDIAAREADCGIQFGSLKRPMHQSTPYEEARFEFSAQRFVDISEPDFGVSLLMGDKYGADLLDGVLKLSLLKAPVEPWPEADRGQHRFTYSLFVHEGDALMADVYAVAAAVDRPHACVLEGLAAPLSFSLCECQTPGVAVESLKPAEDGRGLILRLNEYRGGRATARLRFHREVAAAWRCDMMERDAEELRPEMYSVQLPLKPREIKTLRVILKP